MFLGYRKFKDTFQALAFVGVWLDSTSFVIIKTYHQKLVHSD